MYSAPAAAMIQPVSTGATISPAFSTIKINAVARGRRLGVTRSAMYAQNAGAANAPKIPGGKGDCEHVPRFENVEGYQRGLAECDERGREADEYQEFSTIDAVDDCSSEYGKDEGRDRSDACHCADPEV